MGTKIKKTKMKKGLTLNLFLIFIILPVAFEGLTVGGVFNHSPNAKLIEFCFGKEQLNYDFVEFLDVGQGDATLIKSGDFVALIDFGIKEDGAKIEKHLLRAGIKTINLAIITHHHNDHMGGFLRVAEKINIKKLIINNTTAEDGEAELYNQVISLAKSQNTELILPNAGQNFQIGNALLTILSCNRSANEENNRSIVSMLNIHNKRFLFMSDCDKTCEQNLIQSRSIECDVLKMGHHGSKSSSDFEFLKVTQPSISIASCGYDNMYNHPSDDALARFKELNIKIYRTDLDQSICFTFEKTDNNYQISTERGAA